MGDLKALVADPEFLQLPAANQRALAAQVDPDLAQLDQWGQDRILTRLAPDPYAFTEQRHGLPAGLMQALRHLESSGGTDLVSRTGVMGPYQITGKTGRAYGLPDDQWMDELAQLSTAGNILADNLKTAKGDLRTAVNLYADPNDRAWYADRILARLPQQTQAGAPAGMVASAPPAPTEPSAPMLPGQQEQPPAMATTATTAGVTDQPSDVMAILRRRTGQAPLTTAALTSTPPSTLEADRSRAVTQQAQVTAPIGELLAAANMPLALVGSGVEAATGSPAAGTAAELGLGLGGGVLSGIGAARSMLQAGRANAPMIRVLADQAMKEARDLRRMKLAGTMGPKFMEAIKAAEHATNPADVLRILGQTKTPVTTARVGLEQLGEALSTVPTTGDAVGAIAKGAGKAALGTAKGVTRQAMRWGPLYFLAQAFNNARR